MNVPPIPLKFSPLFKVKPWGGRRLADLFNKPLPPGDPIGESWELVSLPGNESHVDGGPLAGCRLADLIDRWGAGLLGSATLHDGRFPLLIKFLDARQNLSVQVHPKPTARGAPCPGVKHEAWYVVDAEPGAKLYIGLKAGVATHDVAHAAGTPAVADLLRDWPAVPGACYTLPSGTPHALGAGVVVAEVQTPSDVTYRLYDWDRVGLDGRPRELHIEQALAHIRDDVTEEMIRPPPQPVTLSYQSAAKVASAPRGRRRRPKTPCNLTSARGADATGRFAADCYGRAQRLARTQGFAIDRAGTQGGEVELGPGTMRIWIMLSGPPHGSRVCVSAGVGSHRDLPHAVDLVPGDVLLFPADASVRAAFAGEAQWLDVTIP